MNRIIKDIISVLLFFGTMYFFYQNRVLIAHLLHMDRLHLFFKYVLAVVAVVLDYMAVNYVSNALYTFAKKIKRRR